MTRFANTLATGIVAVLAVTATLTANAAPLAQTSVHKAGIAHKTAIVAKGAIGKKAAIKPATIKKAVLKGTGLKAPLLKAVALKPTVLREIVIERPAKAAAKKVAIKTAENDSNSAFRQHFYRGQA